MQPIRHTYCERGARVRAFHDGIQPGDVVQVNSVAMFEFSPPLEVEIITASSAGNCVVKIADLGPSAVVGKIHARTREALGDEIVTWLHGILIREPQGVVALRLKQRAGGGNG